MRAKALRQAAARSSSSERRDSNPTPEVTPDTEFGFEKNGLRFPSLDLTEEAYVDKDGARFVRAVTKVVYKEYKFFTVETETDFEK